MHCRHLLSGPYFDGAIDLFRPCLVQLVGGPVLPDLLGQVMNCHGKALEDLQPARTSFICQSWSYELRLMALVSEPMD